MKTIIDTIKEDGSFTIFLKAAKKTGLQKALKKGEYTVFIPNDEAFNKIPQAEFNMLQERGNREQLAQMLKYHMLKGKLKFKQILKEPETKSLQGFNLNLNDIDLIDTDIECSNGMIHKINDILWPE